MSPGSPPPSPRYSRSIEPCISCRRHAVSKPRCWYSRLASYGFVSGVSLRCAVRCAAQEQVGLFPIGNPTVTRLQGVVDSCYPCGHSPAIGPTSCLVSTLFIVFYSTRSTSVITTLLAYSFLHEVAFTMFDGSGGRQPRIAHRRDLDLASTNARRTWHAASHRPL
ncbi:hypothetical protein LZ30DRAFT_79521 [Colletotrichum cereale]|nr:hypothetical protein LZ30DRAFT_79521 [Colletotrichum cereale]